MHSTSGASSAISASRSAASKRPSWSTVSAPAARPRATRCEATSTSRWRPCTRPGRPAARPSSARSGAGWPRRRRRCSAPFGPPSVPEVNSRNAGSCGSPAWRGACPSANGTSASVSSASTAPDRPTRSADVGLRQQLRAGQGDGAELPERAQDGEPVDALGQPHQHDVARLTPRPASPAATRPVAASSSVSPTGVAAPSSLTTSDRMRETLWPVKWRRGQQRRHRGLPARRRGVRARRVLGPRRSGWSRAGIERNLAEPSPRGIVASREDDAGRFFEDFCNWDRIPEYEQFIRELGRRRDRRRADGLRGRCGSTTTTCWSRRRAPAADAVAPGSAVLQRRRPPDVQHVDAGRSGAARGDARVRRRLAPGPVADAALVHGRPGRWFPEGSLGELPEIEADRARRSSAGRSSPATPCSSTCSPCTPRAASTDAAAGVLGALPRRRRRARAAGWRPRRRSPAWRTSCPPERRWTTRSSRSCGSGLGVSGGA